MIRVRQMKHSSTGAIWDQRVKRSSWSVRAADVSENSRQINLLANKNTGKTRGEGDMARLVLGRAQKAAIDQVHTLKQTWRENNFISRPKKKRHVFFIFICVCVCVCVGVCVCGVCVCVCSCLVLRCPHPWISTSVEYQQVVNATKTCTPSVKSSCLWRGFIDWRTTTF